MVVRACARLAAAQVIAWAPDEYHERIRAQIEGLKPASQFVVTLFPPGAGGVGAGAGGNNGAWAEELPPPGLSKLEELRWKKRRQAADKASGGGGGDGTGRGRGDQSTIPMVAAAVTSVRPPPPCLSADPFLGLPRLPEFEQLVEKKAGDAAASTGAAQSGDGGGGGGDVNGGSGGDDGGGGGGDNDDDGAGDDSGSSPNAAVSPVAEGGAKGDGSSSGVGGETGDGNGDGGSSTDKGGGGGGDDKAQGSGGEGKKQLFTEWLKEVSPVVVDDCKVGPLYPCVTHRPALPAARGMLCCCGQLDRVSARRARLCSYFGEAIPLHLGGDCDVSEFAEKLPAAKLAVSEGGDGWARRVGRGGRISSPPAALDTLRAPRQDAIKMWGIGGSFVAKNLYSRLHFELGYPLSAAQVRVFVEGGGGGRQLGSVRLPSHL
eukprot:COSAG01_NODE_110_length_25904_cov_154.158806_9_plen_432_part_00